MKIKITSNKSEKRDRYLVSILLIYFLFFTVKPLASFYNSALIQPVSFWKPNTLNNLLILTTFLLNTTVIVIRIRHSRKNAKLAPLLGTLEDLERKRKSRNVYSLKLTALKLTAVGMLTAATIVLNRQYLHHYFGKGPLIALVYFAVPCVCFSRQSSSTAES